MRINKVILGVALACITLMSGCAGNVTESSEVTDNAPIIVGVGDAENDNNGEVVGANETDEGDSEYTGPIIHDYGANNSSDESSDKTVSSSSIQGYWADEDGNSAVFYMDNSMVISLDNGNTYYAGKYETDNKSYINIQVYDGVEDGKSLIEEDDETDEVDETEEEIEIDVSKIPGYREDMSEEEKTKILDEWFKEHESNNDTVEDEDDETSDIIKEVKATIVSLEETEQGVVLTLKVPNAGQVSITGYCAVSANESYF